MSKKDGFWAYRDDEIAPSSPLGRGRKGTRQVFVDGRWVDQSPVENLMAPVRERREREHQALEAWLRK